ncbi:MAG: glycosyltransferase [Oscillospiraceae bacterium]|nr:glycosyltransferase [Oscillospiraceae bacterium]
MSVAVALALYDPRLDWLEQQLRSIAAQTYRDIRLTALDDASPNVPFDQIEAVFSACLKGIPYTLARNGRNQGSDAVFAQLTAMAEGRYVSYCDQDDIWLPRKTEALVNTLERTGAALAYSGVSVIDGEGRHVADNLRDVRRRLRYHEGGGLARGLLFRNFTNGTAMMLPAGIARSALPFVRDMTADHWLTLWAAAGGSIARIPEPLVRYRLHGGNQSAVMAGVTGKRSYLERRILTGVSRFEQFQDRLRGEPDLAEVMEDGLQWFRARKRWFEEASGAREVWRYRALGRQVTRFELAAARLPEPVFMALIRLVRRGLL